MNYSLNEMEALAKKAARGSGLSWGLSEEAAKATRWLASFDLPGTKLLAQLLAQNDNVPSGDVAPISVEGIWQAPVGSLCPLHSGALLSDCADVLRDGKTVEMKNVSFPLLVAPFAALVAQYCAQVISVTWGNCELVTDGQRVWISDPEQQISAASAKTLKCFATTAPNDDARGPKLRGVAESAEWQALGKFAHRTYAPATEASRILGAGADSSD